MDDCVDLTVVVPAFRSADTIRPLVARIEAALAGDPLDYRVLFVVDRCPDGSWDVVCRLAAENPRVSGLLLVERSGQHAAVLAGLAAIRARWSVVMDADLQDPPEAIPVLLARARETGGAVFARRRGQYERLDRMITSRLFKTVLRWVSGVPADVGTFFVVPGETARRMCRLPVASPQVVVMAYACATKPDAVPVTRQRRVTGASAYSSAARLRAAVRSVRCARECRRARGLERSAAPCAVAVAERVNA